MREERQALFNTRLRFGSWLVLCALAGGWATSAGAQQAVNLVTDPAFTLGQWRATPATTFKPVPGRSSSNFACIPYTSARKGESDLAPIAKPDNLIYLPALQNLRASQRYRLTFEARREAPNGTSSRTGRLMASVTATEFSSGSQYFPMVYTEQQLPVSLSLQKFSIDFVSPLGTSPGVGLSGRPTEIMFQALSDNDSLVSANVCVTNVQLTLLGSNVETLDPGSGATSIRHNQVVAAQESGSYTNFTVINPPIPSTLQLLSEAGQVVRSVSINSDEEEPHSKWRVARAQFNYSGRATLRLLNAAGSVVAKTDSFMFSPTNPYTSFAPNLRRDALHFFYAQRAGQDIIDRRYQDTAYRNWLDRKAGHKNERASCFTGTDNYGNSFTDACKNAFGSNPERDVSGGWYDAGDHGKYVVNAAASLWALHNVIEYRKSMGRLNSDYPDGMLKYGTNGQSDLLDEAEHEMRWLLKMQIKQGENLTLRVPVGDYDKSLSSGYGVKDDAPATVSIPVGSRTYTAPRKIVQFPLTELKPDQSVGLVFSAVRDSKWSSLPLAPVDALTTGRVLDYPTTVATLNFAAVSAQAARVWRGVNDSFADECLAAAQSAYDAVKRTGNDQIYRYGEYSEAAGSLLRAINQGGGAYAETPGGMPNVRDAWLWANLELYLARSSAGIADSVEAQKLLQDIATRGNVDQAAPFLFKSHEWAESFSWKYNKNMALMSLLVNGRDEDIVTKFAAANPTKPAIKRPSLSLLAWAASTVEKMDQSAFGVPHTTGEVFNWASNADIANSGGMLVYSARYGGGVDYTRHARRVMSYLLGHNPLGKSYVTGYGSNPVRNPHHRFWAKHKHIGFPSAPPGMLVGGPNGKWEGTVLGAQPDAWRNGGDRSSSYYLKSVMPNCNLHESEGTLESSAKIGGIACYQDDIDLYMTNEVAINWNAALFWLSDFLR